MPSSAGNSRLSHPEICSGDHSSASFCATHHRSSGWAARRQGFGRSAIFQASESALLARYALPPLERSHNVGYTLTVPPAVPKLGPLLRREPRPCVPLHTHTSSSGKIRRCCVDRLNPPPKGDVTTINVSMLCRCGTVDQLYEPYPSRGRWISSQFSRTPAKIGRAHV